MARFSQDGNYVASCAADGQVVIVSLPISVTLSSLRASSLIKYPRVLQQQLSVPNLEKVASFTVPGGNSETLAWHPTRNVLAYVGQETGIWGAGL